MVCKFTELRLWVGSAATTTVGLEPMTTRLRALRATDWARRAPTEAWKFKHLALNYGGFSRFHKLSPFSIHFMPSLSPCSFLFLFPCLLFCFHFVCSFFLRFDLFSLFFVVFCSFFLRFVACFLVYPCFVPFCSFLFFFLRFVAFFRLCPCVPFSFRLFFFAPLVPFSPLSFFLSPVSLALLLPPLLFGLFSSNSCKYCKFEQRLAGLCGIGCVAQGTGQSWMGACIAEPGFDPGTFGLWARHASHCATPLSEKILRSLFETFVLVWCGSEKPPRQLQSAVSAFFTGCMVCKFTELRLWVGSAATPTVGLEPTTI